MKALCLLVAAGAASLLAVGCATPAGPPAARNCPPLPTLAAGARRAELLDHIRIMAEMYARCAGAKS